MLAGMTVFAAVDWNDVLKGLGIFWKGMLSIFIVLLAIAIVTFLMNFTAQLIKWLRNRDTEQPPALVAFFIQLIKWLRNRETEQPPAFVAFFVKRRARRMNKKQLQQAASSAQPPTDGKE